jgi:Fe-S-cluster containining protein
MSIPERHALQVQSMERAAACTNVGETGDGQDLYVVFDDLIDTIKRTMPPFACQDGCHYCCRMTPLVSGLEWRPILAFVQKMDPALRRHILRQAESQRPLTWLFNEARRQVLDPTAENAMGAESWCPFLVDGSCSIHAVRPLKCRGYGHSMIKQGGKMRFYGTLKALLHIRESFPAQIDTAEVILPAFDPYQTALDDLNAKAGADSAFLIQWLWAHLRDGELIDEAHLRLPDDSRQTGPA